MDNCDVEAVVAKNFMLVYPLICDLYLTLYLSLTGKKIYAAQNLHRLLNEGINEWLKMKEYEMTN